MAGRQSWGRVILGRLRPAKIAHDVEVQSPLRRTRVGPVTLGYLEEVHPVSVEERVIEIVSEQMGVAKDQITRETSFVNDLGRRLARPPSSS